MKFKIKSIICLMLTSFICHANQNNDTTYILKGINHFRMQHLRMPLKIDERLNVIAYQHSLNMAKHKIPVGHDGFSKRFTLIRTNVPQTTQAAENIAAGYRNVDEVVKGWIHSPGHRQNILGGYRLTGIAIVYDENHKPYYTQIFAK